MIVPALHAAQHRRGYLSRQDMVDVASQCNVPLHKVNAVVSFFPHFRTTRPPKVSIDVCRDMACHLRGSVPLIEKLQRWAAERHPESEVCIRGVSCLGRCDRAPAAMVNEQLHVLADQPRLIDATQRALADRTLNRDSDWDTLGDKGQRWRINPYNRANVVDLVEEPSAEMVAKEGGSRGDGFLAKSTTSGTVGAATYDSVRKYIQNGGRPTDVIKALETAGLLGMGGAGGRAYMKWSDVREATGSKKEKYIVCNADESEPGTFKDREILLATPHLVIEGMIMAGLVTGARRGWIYIRHEYPEQIEACETEIRRAVEIGALGDRMFGSDRTMHLEVFPSPGGYICGEQTALIEAMEGKRGEPRNRPPELMTNGLHDQPTLLSNVETFAWVPAILVDDGQWFAGQGHRTAPLSIGSERGMTGRRMFSISGDVTRPGVYEVPTGITLGTLINEHCGGMAGGVGIAAVALSGPSGGLLPAKIPITALNAKLLRDRVPPAATTIDVTDLPLDIQVSRALGYMLGAGIVIYGQGCDVMAEAVANSRFYRNESCGKCVPCRIGSEKITQMGERLIAGETTRAELPVVLQSAADLGQVMTATSICGLGQVAANPLTSALKFFPELAEAACRR